MRKTLMMVGAAVVLAVIALVTTPRPQAPDAFFDEGEEFFPDFVDPNAARTLEVIQYDAETGTARPFKVTFENGRWTIPSHHGYPADGKDRLAQTAAGLIGLTKDDFRTDNPSDYAACGVLDPLDESNPSTDGRGTRVTIKGENEVVLADIVIGYPVEGREDFFLVRLPEQRRVYGTHLELDLSTQFKDWIEADLMLIERDDIDTVILKDYSVDESTGRLENRDQLMLRREGDEWNASDASDREVDMAKLNNLLRAVDELSIEGVRPKPEGLTATLRKGGETGLTQADLLSLQGRGFYFTNDGRMVSNEGELEVHSADGVTYVLRFGEVVFGEGLAVTAGLAEPEEPGGGGENRYLMITTSFNETEFPEPPRPENTDFLARPDSVWTEEDFRMKGMQTEWERWKQKVDAGRERSQKLNDRFAGWYYVISSESFEKLSVGRDDLLKQKA
jgi:hypothetical protein